LNGDDSYERKYLASQSWMQVASKGKSSKRIALAVSSTLPAENPENLVRPWKQAAPREIAPPDQADSADLAAQSWKATTKAVAAPAPAAVPPAATAALPGPQSTGSIPLVSKPKAETGGAVIQAGSFKNKENADKARTTLAALGSVEVTPIDVDGNVYYRVRVGPFSPTSATKTALAKVKSAGFQGAKIIAGN
jgi:peptidoglycan lytic transglycosylase